MKIVLLDHINNKVIYLGVENEIIKNIDVKLWLAAQGYSPYDYSFLVGKNSYGHIPIEFHRYAIHKGDGSEVHETCDEMLRFGSVYQRVKDLKRRELEECAAALEKHGEFEDGGYEKHFEAEKPVVAGYLYDEPCNIVVNAVRFADDLITIIGYDENDPFTEQEITSSELFAGQLNEITERI